MRNTQKNANIILACIAIALGFCLILVPKNYWKMIGNTSGPTNYQPKVLSGKEIPELNLKIVSMNNMTDEGLGAFYNTTFTFNAEIENESDSDITAMGLHLYVSDVLGHDIFDTEISGNVSIPARQKTPLTLSTTFRDFADITPEIFSAYYMSLENLNIDIQLKSITVGGVRANVEDECHRVHAGDVSPYSNDLVGTYVVDDNQNGDRLVEFCFKDNGAFGYYEYNALAYNGQSAEGNYYIYTGEYYLDGETLKIIANDSSGIDDYLSRNLSNITAFRIINGKLILISYNDAYSPAIPVCMYVMKRTGGLDTLFTSYISNASQQPVKNNGNKGSETDSSVHQNQIPAASKDEMFEVETESIIYMVTTDNINVRSGAGKNQEKIGKVYSGSIVRIYDILENVDGLTWFCIDASGNEWIASDGTWLVELEEWQLAIANLCQGEIDFRGIQCFAQTPETLFWGYYEDGSNKIKAITQEKGDPYNTTYCKDYSDTELEILYSMYVHNERNSFSFNYINYRDSFIVNDESGKSYEAESYALSTDYLEYEYWVVSVGKGMRKIYKCVADAEGNVVPYYLCEMYNPEN